MRLERLLDLSADELAEALALVRAELAALPVHPADPYRWGFLLGRLDSLAGPDARVALGVLRRFVAERNLNRED